MMIFYVKIEQAYLLIIRIGKDKNLNTFLKKIIFSQT